MDTLGKLFGSNAKVKIMRLFLLNAERSFTLSDVIERAKVRPSTVRRELTLLEKIGFIKRRSFFRARRRAEDEHPSPPRRRLMGWIVNDRFSHLAPLRALLTGTNTLVYSDIAHKVGRAGKIKFLVISGILIQDPDSRVDLLIVGDHIRDRMLDQAVKSIEAEVGKELRYAVFDTKQFQYRMNIYDRLVRDVLDYPHQTIVDRLGISMR